MKTFKLFSLLMLTLLVLRMPQVFSQNQENQNIIGIWQGDLALPNGAKITMVFKVTEEAGTLKAGMDVPAQGAKDIPVEKVVFATDSASFDVRMINGIFTGKMTGDGKILDGKWVQNGVTLPLKLEKTDKTSEMKRPQLPLGPFPYKSEDVTYENKKSGIKLAGTLTLPEGTQKSPAVVLISGSGPQNRDEEIFGHKPFLVLSDYLTRRGIAVLRVDDRGVGGSTGNIRAATSEDFAGDVLCGIDYLKSRPEINSSEIGLIGHSEGGIIAPIAAVKSNDVSFIVLLAGPGLVGEQILYMQGKLINKGMGMTDEQAEQNTKLQEAIFNVIKNEKNDSLAQIKLREAYTAGTFNSLNAEQKNAIDARIEAVNTPWFKFFLTYDPSPTLEKVKCPTLALIGEKDLQVPPDENLEAIGVALKKAGNENFRTLKLEALNHLFQPCKTGLISEYGLIEETFSPNALKIIGDWIQEVVKE